MTELENLSKERQSVEEKKEKRYYWLKLMDGFFDNKHIKLLRSQENGDKIVIIYLMLQLKALKADGIIDYMKILPSIEEEIAVDIGESIESVKTTIELLKKMNLVEFLNDSALYMITKKELLDYGTETAAAERQRRSRENRKSRMNLQNDLTTDIVANCDDTPDETDTGEEIQEYTPEFTLFWDAYPRKIGKGEAYKKYKARRNDGYSPEQLMTAAKNYASQVKKAKTDKQYIKHPKTFLSDTMPFVDFLPKKQTMNPAPETVEGGNPFKDWDKS